MRSKFTCIKVYHAVPLFCIIIYNALRWKESKNLSSCNSLIQITHEAIKTKDQIFTNWMWTLNRKFNYNSFEACSTHVNMLKFNAFWIYFFDIFILNVVIRLWNAPLMKLSKKNVNLWFSKRCNSYWRYHEFQCSFTPLSRLILGKYMDNSLVFLLIYWLLNLMHKARHVTARSNIIQW